MSVEKIVCVDCKGTDFRQVKTDITCQKCGHILTDEEISKTLQESYEQYKQEGADVLYWLPCPPISAKEPECYKPNDNPYPLCIGNGSEKCEKCCIYENMEEPPFDK